MNEQEKQKLNKKLEIWVFGHKQHLSCNFTNSLDKCFEWLMPKVYAYSIQSFNNKHRDCHISVALLYTSLDDMQEFSATVSREENPALALCLAIEKLIDAEKK